MNKAILILDEMPKSCIDCEIFDNEQLLCLGGKVHFKDIDKVQSWCPLKPMPKKKDEYKEALESFNGNMSNELHFACEGWNACLEQILGEENE